MDSKTIDNQTKEAYQYVEDVHLWVGCRVHVEGWNIGAVFVIKEYDEAKNMVSLVRPRHDTHKKLRIDLDKLKLLHCKKYKTSPRYRAIQNGTHQMKINKPNTPVKEVQMDNIIVAIIGSRNFTDMALLTLKMDQILGGRAKENITIISGGAHGADTLAKDYAKLRGITFEEYPADWDNIEGVPDHQIKENRYGKKYNCVAGHDRNLTMAKEATHCVAFWDRRSPGTRNMIGRCERNNVIVRIVETN
jgi:hypothetical protein